MRSTAAVAVLIMALCASCSAVQEDERSWPGSSTPSAQYAACIEAIRDGRALTKEWCEPFLDDMNMMNGVDLSTKYIACIDVNHDDVEMIETLCGPYREAMNALRTTNNLSSPF